MDGLLNNLFNTTYGYVIFPNVGKGGIGIGGTAGIPKLSYYGDAVLSEGILYWKGTNEGKPFMNAEFSVTDIWVYRNERWQIHMRLLQFLKNR